MNKKILIIPDVHGRTFWESALKSGDYEKIVFLGDYTDPYEIEGITNSDALKNFKSIISFKQQNPEISWLILISILSSLKSLRQALPPKPPLKPPLKLPLKLWSF